MPDGIDQSHVSLDWVGRDRREWMTIGRREASLVTSAMLGSAIAGTCTVTCYWSSQGRSGKDEGGE